MKLINITPVTKNRIKEMITWLIPQVGYVRVTNHGLVIMKRSRWAFKRDILNITDVCISLLPNKIAELISGQDSRVEYTLELNKHISNLIYMKYYNDSFEIVEYIWRKYTEMISVPLSTPVNSATILREANSMGQLLPEISSLSSKRKLFGVVKDIINSKNSAVESEKNKLLKKVKQAFYMPKRVNKRFSVTNLLTFRVYTART